MSLIDAVRESCSSETWSAGVRIARSGAVVSTAHDEDEVVFRVAMRGGAVPFTVHLWPDDPDWSCDCPSGAQACAHVAAAAITWKHGGASPARPAAARIGYRLHDTDRGLALTRVVIQGQSEDPLPGSLATAAAALPVPLLATDADRAVEEACGFYLGQPLPRGIAEKVARALADCADVTLDGRPIKVAGRPVVPHARIEDAAPTPAPGRRVARLASGEVRARHDPAFRVRIVRDPAIREVFRNGFVLCHDPKAGEVAGVLRPIGDGGLSREQRRMLSRGVRFELDEVGRLVGDVLPMLRERVPVDVRTRRLPEGQATPPRLQVTTRAEGETLVVRPELIYGEPPLARIERGELVRLGEVVPIRDRKAEEKLSRKASQELGVPIGIEARFVGPSAVRFVERLQASRIAATGGGLHRFKRRPDLVPELSVVGDRLRVKFSSPGAEAAEADPGQVIAAWRAGSSMVPVRGGGWAAIPREWLEAHGELVGDLLAARDPATGRVARQAIFDLARLCEQLDAPPPPDLDRLRPLIDGFEGLPTAQLPADLCAELRPYQRQGVNWLAFLRDQELGGILADDMGLGKTLMALCAVPRGTLVVAPTSVLHNWVSEAARFRPGLRVNLYHGPDRRLDPNADLTVTSYALLRLDASSLHAHKWAAVVLDEAQAIKNPESQVAQAAYLLEARWRLTLTGTPVENRLDELWSQFHFLQPGLLGGRRDFQERYARPIAAGESRVAAHLRARIRPFVLRRMKQDVASELPPRTDLVLRCRLKASERAVYDAIRAAAQHNLVKMLDAGNTMAVLEALLRLRQAACDPALVPGAHLEDAGPSSKVELLLETLDEVTSEGHKALVFSQWTRLLDRIEPHLRSAGLDFVRLDGSTPDRRSVVARFQSEEGPPVFLISLKAGGVGLNLTAANHVVLLDPWWNPAVEDQAADRAHRIGQDQPVTVFRLVAEDTVEERILALQERKRALAEAALGDADRAASLSREDLLALLA